MSPLVQADGEVQLQDDWIQPTRETEPEDGGKVQAPAEGDTLQTFIWSTVLPRSNNNGYLAQYFPILSFYFAHTIN